MPAPHYEPGSFRDPAARVFRHQNRIFRCLGADALRDWQHLSHTTFFSAFVADGRLIDTIAVDDRTALPDLDPNWVAVLEHQPVPVVSYPYEWCFGMLRDAALLQLDLLLAALDEGMTLKDATPFNVQWFGVQPTFIDVASFTIAEPGEPWAGYRQFCQLFLYPLLLQAYKDVPFQPWLRGSLEGIEPMHLRRVLALRDYARAGVLTHVYLLSKVQARYQDTERDVKTDLRRAGFSAALVKNNVSRMRRLVDGLRWDPPDSTWSEYTTCNTYTDDDQQQKAAFVQRVIGERRRDLVWDVGCNTGLYSRIAAENTGQVVAIDGDHLAIERLYGAVKLEPTRNILPLVGDIADPTPPLGWRGLERPALLDRARPDLMLCLALVHHIVIGRNVPIPDFVEWLAESGAEVVVEFVTRDDPMVGRLLRNRDILADGYTIERFEAVLSETFDVVAKEPLGSGTRTLYHAHPRQS
jgi:hypothetical protein